MRITWEKFRKDVNILAKMISERDISYDGIYAIPRGGVNVGVLLSEKLGLPLKEKNEITDRTLVVDDLIDSGRTGGDYKNDIAVLYIKAHSPKPAFYIEEVEGWIEFFYEETEVDIENVIVRQLEYIGEDPNRDGLKDTPKRIKKSWDKLYGGYKQDPGAILKTVFDQKYDEIVLLKNIELFSNCEHHLLPFFGKCHIAYIPSGKVVGISKLARLMECYSRRMQIQERLCNQIVDAMEKYLAPKGSACIIEAQHFCMTSRGVEKQNSVMVTSALRGVFMEKKEARAELMTLIKG